MTVSLLPFERFSGVKRSRDSSAGSPYLALGSSLDSPGAEYGGNTKRSVIAEAMNAEIVWYRFRWRGIGLTVLALRDTRTPHY